MKKYILYIIFGLVILGVFLYMTDSRFNSLLTSKKEPRGMIDQDNQHGGGHQAPVAQSHRSYGIQVISGTEGVNPNKTTKIVYQIKNDKGEIIKNFAVAHEKIMHFIVVRKDLQNFQHLHPEFNKDSGEFAVTVIFPTDGPYRIFPDFTPGDENPQKLPVTVFHDIEVGSMNKYKAQILEPDKGSLKTQEGYQVIYKFPDANDLKSQKTINYGIDVVTGGHPVTNLDKYLGALGHSVILKEKTLDFIHTHAEEQMNNSKMNDAGSKKSKINFSATFPATGIYKIFTQFQHEGKVITTDYIANVK